VAIVLLAIQYLAHGADFMPDKSNDLLIGPVRVMLPPGCVAQLFFSFDARDEKLNISSYQETQDGGPGDVAARRVASVAQGLGDSLQVLRQQPGTIFGFPSYLLLLRFKDDSGHVSNSSQFFIETGPRRFIELRYEFGANSSGSQDDFDTVVRSLRLKAAGRPPADRQPSPPAWITWDLPEITMALPTRLKRTTPYTFNDPERRQKWVADAWSLPRDAMTMQSYPIPPEPNSPIPLDRHQESFSSNNVAGTLTFLRTVNTETGKPGNRVARAEVLVDQHISVVIRGTAPDSSGDALGQDIKSILGAISVTEH